MNEPKFRIKVLRLRIAKLKKQNKDLKETLNKVYEAGYEGIQYVGSANYADRESEALSKLRHAMDYEDGDA
jgi:hypothetical protein